MKDMKDKNPDSQTARQRPGRRRPHSHSWLFGFLVCWLCVSSFADSITFDGTNIPLRDCNIEAIQGGQVTYLDVGGQRQRRPLEQVAAIGFQNLPQLDQGELALANNDSNAGLTSLLMALVSAQTDLQRLWVHARLARVHDMRHEYIQAAGHLAATMMLSDDPYWRAIEPSGDANEPDFPAAKEAMDNLQAAARKVKANQLKTSIERMLGKVKPVFERLSKSYTGPAIASGSTLSGISKQDILNGKLQVKSQPATRISSQPAAAPPARPESIEPSKPRAAETREPARLDSPAAPAAPPAIDALLGQSKWSEALAACQGLAANPDDRDLAHFLLQFGTALVHVDRPDDAAVMFARCAVLFSDSADAAQALIQLAVVYRDHYRNRDTARRLLQRAIDQGTAQGHDSAVLLARELLGSL